MSKLSLPPAPTRGFSSALACLVCFFSFLCSPVVLLFSMLAWSVRFFVLLSAPLRIFLPLFLCVVLLFAAPPVDIDAIRESVSRCLFYENNVIPCVIIPTSMAIGLHFYVFDFNFNFILLLINVCKLAYQIICACVRVRD